MKSRRLTKGQVYGTNVIYLMDKIEGIEKRLREISDQIVQLRMYVNVEPANAFLIELLEIERQEIIKTTIKVVT